MIDKILIKNLPYDTEESELWSLFIPYGRVHKIEIAQNRLSGHSIGYAYLTMENADIAIDKLNNIEFGNRILHLSKFSN